MQRYETKNFCRFRKVRLTLPQQTASFMLRVRMGQSRVYACRKVEAEGKYFPCIPMIFNPNHRLTGA